MIRETISEQLDHDPHFRWRGGEVTRIENLSDIVFAIALGMLVSASEVPQNWFQLKAHLVNIIPVALGFILMLVVWNAHFTFFRRYGVGDKKIIIVNAALLLVILYIAYPLRFVFDSLFAYIQGAAGGDWSRMGDLGFTGQTGSKNAAKLTAYFTIGYSLLFSLVLAMYSHAMKRANVLNLSTSERVITMRSIWLYRIEVILGISATIGALFTSMGPFSAFILTLNWPLKTIINKKLKLPMIEEKPHKQAS